jgi:prepilin-type N-terminal cleavage/methylation domain-containing protein
MKTSSKMKKQDQRGFTLVEIAIVLMIIGLLIGGILRGQELIQSARVRNIIDQKSAIQTAMIGFEDRFRMKAGDLSITQAPIVGPSAVSNNQPAPKGWINMGGNDTSLFFQNLAASGFISCGPCMTMVTPGGAAYNATNGMTNAQGNLMYYGRAGANNGVGGWWWDLAPANNVRNVLTTGGGISPDILAEVDRKADDGRPGTGGLRHSTVGGLGNTAQCAPALTTAADVAAVGAAVWQAAVDWDSCAAAWLM